MARPQKPRIPGRVEAAKRLGNDLKALTMLAEDITTPTRELLEEAQAQTDTLLTNTEELVRLMREAPAQIQMEAQQLASHIDTLKQAQVEWLTRAGHFIPQQLANATPENVLEWCRKAIKADLAPMAVAELYSTLKLSTSERNRLTAAKIILEAAGLAAVPAQVAVQPTGNISININAGAPELPFLGRVVEGEVVEEPPRLLDVPAYLPPEKEEG